MPGHLSTPYESWESDNKVAPQGQAQEPADACECVVPTLSPNSTPQGPNVNQAEKGILADTHSLQTPTEFKGATIPTSAMSKYPSIVLGLCRGSRLRSQVSLFIQWRTLSLPGDNNGKVSIAQGSRGGCGNSAASRPSGPGSSFQSPGGFHSHFRHDKLRCTGTQSLGAGEAARSAECLLFKHDLQNLCERLATVAHTSSVSA